MGDTNQSGSLKNHISLSIKRVQLRQSQKNYVRAVNENQIVFCHGPAGTSKTFTACYTALKMLANKEIQQIILCKPLEDSGRSLGFIPGDINEKIAPYVKSYKSNIEKIIGVEKTQMMFDKNIIKFEPLAYMRGDTYDDALMILDEAQNAPIKALMLFVTRMGKNSKCIVAGDVTQHDIAKRDVQLPKFIEMVEGVKGVSVHIFTEKDIVRAKILIDIVKRYDNWKYQEGR